MCMTADSNNIVITALCILLQSQEESVWGKTDKMMTKLIHLQEHD